MGNWSLEVDTIGNGTFSDSVINLLPFNKDLNISDEWRTGYFKPKSTDFNTDGSVNVLHTYSTKNKSFSMFCLTTFETILNLQEWCMGACHEYSHLDPKWVVRPKDGDGNIVALSSNRFPWCIITDLGFVIKAGDPTRITANITLKAVGYR